MKQLKLIAVLLVLLVIGFYIDNFILDLINVARTELLNNFFILFSIYFNYYVLALIITIVPLFKNDKLKNLLKLWLSFLTAGILVFILKLVIQRPRPLINLIETTNSSFPSRHTTIMFALLPVIYKDFKEIKYIWLVLCLFVALSRIYLGVHHFSDIIGGIILGIFIGINIDKLIINKKWKI